MSRESKTAAEFMKELKRNKQYQEMRRQQDTEIAERVRLDRKEQEQLLMELSHIGNNVRYIEDLIELRTIKRSDEAIFLLLKHLGRPYRKGTRTSIAGALQVKPAREFLDEIIEHYHREPEGHVKQMLANTVGALLTKETIGKVEQCLLADPSSESKSIIKSHISDLNAGRDWFKDQKELEKEVNRERERRGFPPDYVPQDT